MATNIEEIKGFLDDAKLKYRDYPGKNYLRTGFRTDNYMDSDGDKTVGIIITIEEDGEFIKFVVPEAYKFDKNLSSFHKMALFQTLLQVSHMTKMMQFEYDIDDGEIWAIIEFPLEDSNLTQKQLLRCIHGMANILDEHHEMIADSIKHGLTPEGEKEQRKAFEEFQRSRRQERRDQFGGE